MTEEEASFLEKAENFSEGIKLKCHEFYDTQLRKSMMSHFGGYRVEESAYVIVMEGPEAYIITECKNCGDATYVRITDMLN